MAVQEWPARAACVGVNPDLFTISLRGSQGLPESAEQQQQNETAKAICRGCSVQRECHDEGVAQNDRWTIRAGLTPSERRAMTKATTNQRRRSA